MGVNNGSAREVAQIGDESGVVLSVIERKIIAGALSGHSISEISHATGVEPDRVRKFLRAQDVPQLRRAFQRVLDSRGLTATAMADKAKELLEAKEPKWNKADDDWDFFPALAVQTTVWKHLTRLHDLEPTATDRGERSPALKITINASLGEVGAKAGADPDHLVIDVPVQVAEENNAAQKRLLEEEKK